MLSLLCSHILSVHSFFNLLCAHQLPWAGQNTTIHHCILMDKADLDDNFTLENLLDMATDCAVNSAAIEETPMLPCSIFQ